MDYKIASLKHELIPKSLAYLGDQAYIYDKVGCTGSKPVLFSIMT